MQCVEFRLKTDGMQLKDVSDIQIVQITLLYHWTPGSEFWAWTRSEMILLIATCICWQMKQSVKFQFVIVILLVTSYFIIRIQKSQSSIFFFISIGCIWYLFYKFWLSKLWLYHYDNVDKQFIFILIVIDFRWKVFFISDPLVGKHNNVLYQCIRYLCFHYKTVNTTRKHSIEAGIRRNAISYTTWNEI